MLFALHFRIALSFRSDTLSTPLSPRLQITSQRLCVVAASSNVHAGYKCSFTQFVFRGVSAAITQNRKLAAGIFVIRFSTNSHSFSFLFKFLLAIKAIIRFLKNWSGNHKQK
jgi:hypothetical protein